MSTECGTSFGSFLLWYFWLFYGEMPVLTSTRGNMAQDLPNILTKRCKTKFCDPSDSFPPLANILKIQTWQKSGISETQSGLGLQNLRWRPEEIAGSVAGLHNSLSPLPVAETSTTTILNSKLWTIDEYDQYRKSEKCGSGRDLRCPEESSITSSPPIKPYFNLGSRSSFLKWNRVEIESRGQDLPEEYDLDGCVRLFALCEMD